MPGKHKQISDKFFGYFAVHKKHVNPQQLVEVLDIQLTEKIRNGKCRLVCEIMVDLEYITIEQVGEVFTAFRNARRNGNRRLLELST